MNRTTARTLHSVVHAAELAAIAAAAALAVGAAAWLWSTADALPWPVTAVVGAYTAAAGGRAALEIPTAWRAGWRWHSWAHRNIDNRTEPTAPRQRALARKETRR